MSTIQTDFDRIALVSVDGAIQNEHYQNFLLRQLPSSCQDALEIGCGTGAFARLLAQRSQNVLAVDLSPEMIRIARERSAQFPNIEFELADVCDRVVPVELHRRGERVDDVRATAAATTLTDDDCVHCHALGARIAVLQSLQGGHDPTLQVQSAASEPTAPVSPRRLRSIAAGLIVSVKLFADAF